MADTELQLDKIHPDLDRSNDEIDGEIQRIFEEHATSLLAESNSDENRMAGLTHAISQLVQHEVSRAATPRSRMNSDAGIVERLAVPDHFGHQYLNVPGGTLRRSASNDGSAMSRSGYNMEPFQAADEHDLVLEALDMQNAEEVRSFASTKVVAEGMMDIALLTANANQLRFLCAYNRDDKTFVFSLSLIVASLILQVTVGIGLLIKNRLSRLNEHDKLRMLHDFLVIGVYMVTVINILAATTTDMDY